MEFYFHGVDRDLLILKADGGLDSENADAFMAELGSLVDAGARKLIVDCSRLRFISSYGIAVLVRAHKKLAERGGNVKLAAVDSRVVRLLEFAGLSKILGIFPNVDAARAAFGREDST
jgi:anti-sigma B factor antagonist